MQDARAAADFRRKYPPPSEPEDRLTKTIDDFTAGISSSAFLGVAVSAMLLSLLLQTTGRQKWGNFLAQWIPACLLFGVYSKLVKLETPDISDSSDRGSYFQ